jgi:hypothetical protein
MKKANPKGGNHQAGRKKDHLVFFICILLAASFWFFIKLADIYPVSYTLKVKYHHVPSGRLITSLEDSTVTIHFKSNGYNLLDLMLHHQLDTLHVDLVQCDIRKESNKEFSVTTASLRESTAQLLGVNDRDLEFSKPALKFFMEKLHRKRMALKAQLDLHFKSQYQLYSYKIVPSTVTVYGPRQILDTLKTLFTARVHLEELAGDRKVKALVKNPYPQKLSFHPSSVVVQLEVEKYTEQEVKIPVDVSGIKPPIRTFPNTVTVRFNIFVRDYEKVHPSQFKVVPHIRNINLRKVKTLPLDLVAQPKIIRNPRIVPATVEFIIIN